MHSRALPWAIAAYAFSMLSLAGLIVFMNDIWLPWTAGSGELQAAGAAPSPSI